MHDAAIAWVDGEGDLAIATDDLLIDNTLTNQVIISLFTDRAVADYELDRDQLNRGWWGDSFSDSPWGSRLWLIAREKSMDSVLDRAKAYATEALQWMIKDGLITALDVIARRESLRNDQVKDHLFLDIYMLLPTGAKEQRTLRMELTNAV